MATLFMIGLVNFSQKKELNSHDLEPYLDLNHWIVCKQNSILLFYFDDEFLFDQGPTRKLGEIQFHDYNKAFELYNLPNLTIFKEQINTFKESLIMAPASKEQMKDIEALQ